MLKRVANRQRKGNKVVGRYKYISTKADWTMQNTFERFDFLVKKMFKDKQDTTHLVYSFSRNLEGEEKEKARKRISEIIDSKFGNEYFYCIAEHNDNGKTHYHILISRNIETGRMLHLDAKQYKQLQNEVRKHMEPIQNEKEREATKKYLNRINMNKGNIKTNLDPYQHKDYIKNKDKSSSLLPDIKDFETKKAFLKAFAERLREALEDKLYEELAEELSHSTYELKIEETKKGRIRFYLYENGKKIGRLDRLTDYTDKLYSFIYHINNKIQNHKQRQHQEPEKQTEKENEVIKINIHKYKNKSRGFYRSR